MRTIASLSPLLLVAALCCLGLASCQQEDQPPPRVESAAQVNETQSEPAVPANQSTSQGSGPSAGVQEGQPPRSDSPATRQGLSLSVSCPRATFGPAEPIPLAYTVRNESTEAVYASIACGALLMDSRGERATPAGPVDTPPPAPGDMFIKDQEGHRTVQVERVQLLKPGESYTEALEDPLRTYRPVHTGDYRIVAVASLRLYGPDAIITRQEMPHKTWAALENAKSQFELEQPVSVRIR